MLWHKFSSSWQPVGIFTQILNCVTKVPKPRTCVINFFLLCVANEMREIPWRAGSWNRVRTCGLLQGALQFIQCAKQKPWISRLLTPYEASDPSHAWNLYLLVQKTNVCPSKTMSILVIRIDRIYHEAWSRNVTKSLTSIDSVTRTEDSGANDLLLRIHKIRERDFQFRDSSARIAGQSLKCILGWVTINLQEVLMITSRKGLSGGAGQRTSPDKLIPSEMIAKECV
jgi:hypothetical protein